MLKTIFVNYFWHTIQTVFIYGIAFEFLNFIQLLQSYDHLKLMITNFSLCLLHALTASFLQLSHHVADEKLYFYKFLGTYRMISYKYFWCMSYTKVDHFLSSASFAFKTCDILYIKIEQLQRSLVFAYSL